MMMMQEMEAPMQQMHVAEDIELLAAPERLDVLWAQRSDRVFVKVSLADCAPSDACVSFGPDGDGVCVTWARADGTRAECHLALAGRVDAERCRWAKREKFVAVLLPKSADFCDYWPRLGTQGEARQGGCEGGSGDVLACVGVDWDLWKPSPSERDSDESDSDASEGPLDLAAVVRETNDFGYDDDSDVSETGLDY